MLLLKARGGVLQQALLRLKGSFSSITAQPTGINPCLNSPSDACWRGAQCRF